MQEFLYLIFLLILSFVPVIMIRWVFRIDHIVTILEKMSLDLTDLKRQNQVLIRQQDEILDLLDSESETNPGN